MIAAIATAALIAASFPEPGTTECRSTRSNVAVYPSFDPTPTERLEYTTADGVRGRLFAWGMRLCDTGLPRVPAPTDEHTGRTLFCSVYRDDGTERRLAVIKDVHEVVASSEPLFSWVEGRKTYLALGLGAVSCLFLAKER